MITSPITRPITSRIASAIAGARVAAGRWYLHWGGVNERAEMSEWSASGFGDSISETLVAADPGNGDQYLWSSSDGLFALYIANTTAALTLKYTDIDGSTARSIVGPAIVAGAGTTYTVSLNADGVTLTVDATDYDNVNVPELGTVVYFSSDNTPANHFEGVYWDRRFTNATALQGVNAVQSDGVNLTGTIPAITLTSSTISFPLLYKSGNQTILTGSAAILTVSSDLFVKGANVTSLLVDGQEYASETLVDGQHYDIVIAVDGGTLTTIGLMAAGGIMGTLTVDDAVYDLSGDDGLTIPNTGVGSDGTWNNYDSGTDQIALPILSRRYEIKDGPDALFLEDANHPLGPELVTNGGFDDGTTSWVRITGVFSVVDGVLRLTSEGGTVNYGLQDIPVEIGKSYLYSGRIRSNAPGKAAYLGAFVNSTINYPQSDSSGEWVFFQRVITITSGNTLSVRPRFDSTVVGEYGEFDNMSVKCIETGAQLVNVSPEDWDRSKT